MENYKYKLNMLKARIAYYSARHGYNPEFTNIINKAIDKAKENEKNLKKFKDFIEAIVAFHVTSLRKTDKNKDGKDASSSNQDPVMEEIKSNPSFVVGEIMNDDTGDKLIKYSESLAMHIKNLNSNQLRKIFEEVKKIK